MTALDQATPAELLGMAEASASLGHEDDAVEFFARALASANRLDLGETPAIEFIRALPDYMNVAGGTVAPALAEAVERVAARYDAPVVLEQQVDLSPEATAALFELVEHPPEPTEALRRLFDGASH